MGEEKLLFGGGEDKLVIGVRGNPRLPPLNETLVCVDSTVFVFLPEVTSAWVYMSTSCCCSGYNENKSN